jgi:hypothetical protein
MEELYHRVAQAFANRIQEVFMSEETMEAEFKKSFEHLEFNRTDHGSTMLYKMFRDCWYAVGPEIKSEPTGYDRLFVCRKLYHLLDYNLFTQVLLNLQSYTGMVYLTEDAAKEMEKLQAEWPKDAKLNPFEPKVKMVKNAATDEEKKYNNILSTIKSLKIIAQFTPQVSFRITPIGSTPAFADSRNISMIGIGGDKYLRTLPDLKPFYIHWAPGSSPQIVMYNAEIIDSLVLGAPSPHPPSDPRGAKLTAPGIPYAFFSKSGGEILNEALFARKVMAEVFAAHDITAETCIMIPRMNSVLVVTGQHGVHLKRAFESLKQQYPMLELAEGTRT